jgi:subtilisin family serine protease
MGSERLAMVFPEGGQMSHVIRATVDDEKSVNRLLESVEDKASPIIGVFSDPRIDPVAVCPLGPVGTDTDIEELLLINRLQERGMTGAGVRVVIVDTGVNIPYLAARGKRPLFDEELSWAPHADSPVGNMPIGHGTMCAYDACIAAPECTIIDHALLTSTTPGGSVMGGFLSDAVQSYGVMLSWMARTAGPFAGEAVPRTLVVNNSWGMFHPSWDFDVGHPANYSDNPNHPFNLIVASLEAAGADIFFAAGNCGTECPDGRCQGETEAGIFGANSSEAVSCISGVIKTNERIGYSTKGPGRLEDKKPDVASYTHFAGSGVYQSDGGTSAATPVAAGVVAAIRRLYPSHILPPYRLRQIVRETAEPQSSGFNYEYGHGVINVDALLERLEEI